MTSFRRRLVWRRALDWLTTYHPFVIAVTGSVGKSTTAAAIARVVATKQTVRLVTPLSSDPLAVALAILGSPKPPADVSWYEALTLSFARELIEQEPAVIVLEAAAERPGDVDWLATHVPPDITVVTNVGTVQTEFFDAKENVAHELSSLVTTTNPAGFVVINNDDEFARAMPTLTKAAALSFGTTPAADVYLARANRQASGGFIIEVRTHQEIVELPVPHLIARPQLLSLVAALAVGHALRIPLRQAASALQAFPSLPGRMQPVLSVHGARLIDDSATATPESMMAALETLRALPSRRRIAIIGDIHQLGRHAQRLHRHIGHVSAQVANIVIAVGEQMRAAGSEALKLGVDVHHFETASNAGKWLADFIRPEDTILVSGGREMHMSEVVERLKKK